MFDYLRAEAGARIAHGYVERLMEACMSLARFPRQGAPHDDISPGIRILGFEKRVAIAYRVTAEVEIVRILYGGRDLRRALSDEVED